MLHDFYEIFTDCGVLCAELRVKIPGDLVKGFQSSGLKICGSLVTPKY